ncbi:unnamed protein product [Oncorhynchus mykiss]|uniref:FERM domain-containing protein n=1 Tax=Oncorhynchus mykiss TaxID=8022 RepID=A0A060YTW3_ONCMY|nr:unnamed protein product [Oncorhynchus mykiss]
MYWAIRTTLSIIPVNKHLIICLLIFDHFRPRITKVHFKETQFELQVVGKDCTETSFFFKAPNKTACKHLWKCCIEHHTFFRMPENDGNTLTRKLSKFGSLGSKHRYSGKTAMQMGRDPSVSLPRPDLQVVRTRSKTYSKRPSSQTTGLNNVNRSNTKTENEEKEGTTKITAQSALKSSIVTKTENGDPEEQRGKPSAPWDENAPQCGLYNTASQRTKSPKFLKARGRTPSAGSGKETSQNPRWCVAFSYDLSPMTCQPTSPLPPIAQLTLACTVHQLSMCTLCSGTSCLPKIRGSPKYMRIPGGLVQRVAPPFGSWTFLHFQNT